MTDTRKITVLIDSDNTPHAMLSLIMDELSTYGQIIVKRAYGDFSSDYLKNWKQPLNELAIQPASNLLIPQAKMQPIP